MNIYQIQENISERLERLQERLDNGELPPPDDGEVQELLGLIEGDLADKLEAYRYVVLNKKAKEKSYKEEIAKLQQGKKTVSNSLDRLENAIFMAIKASGQKKFEFDVGSVAIHKSSESVRIDIDPKHLPPKFQKVTVEADTTAIKKFLKDGGEIKGVTLVQGEHLRIK
ncbi:siphovirus Gp157 family protein [Moraxella lacunata]|nr:siphovirus Gp157 family protein [Moraxella lacunata]